MVPEEVRFSELSWFLCAGGLFQFPVQPCQLDECAHDDANLSAGLFAPSARVMVDANLFHGEAGSFRLDEKLRANRAAGRSERYLLNGPPSYELKGAIHIPNLNVEELPDQPVPEQIGRAHV